MSHAHGHDPGRGASKRGLAIAFGLVALFMVVEAVGGLLAGSLALLADAGHMLSDAFALGLALVAIRLAERPPTSKRTFGLKRAEILAALFNGATLVAISIWIFVEAYQRLRDPPEVAGATVLAIALAGLVVNIAAAAALYRGREETLNVSAAFRHVLADLLGSAGVLVAGAGILLTGWRELDPLIGALIGLLVVASAWGVLRDSVRILLEGSPPGLDVDAVGRRMASADGVVEVHDLHVWTITSGFPALAAHVLVGQDDDCHERRRELERVLREEFEIDHTTLQVDHAPAERPLQIELPDRRESPRFEP